MKIFVSYSRRDAGDFADQIQRLLSTFNYDIFTGVDKIQLGDVWSNTIEENISNCDIFVVIVTQGALHSLHVEKEVLQAQKENKTIIPCFHKDVLVSNIKWGLENIQGIEFSDKYELARNLNSKISSHSQLSNSRISPDSIINIIKQKTNTIEFTIEEGNIAHYMSDVIALKYAQGFFGADLYISTKIGESSRSKVESLLPGDHLLIDSKGDILSKKILFIGVTSDKDFDYEQIRKFSFLVLKILENDDSVRNIAMTIHGVGFGLDETESAYAQLGGILDAFRENNFPKQLQRISIVDRNEDRVIRLRKAFDKILSKSDFAFKSESEEKWIYDINPNFWSKKSSWNFWSKKFPSNKIKTGKPKDNESIGIKEIDTAGIQTRNKHVIFVAMPFKKEMNNLFYFGIQQPATEENFLCERTDLDSANYTTDIITQIKKRIDSSSLVIAVLTDSNPNVYLEVGYAWGKNKPTLFLIRKGEQPKFDLQGFRYFEYEDDDIKPIRDTLIKQIKGLKDI